jgi:dTDP-4-amino-4,6-dideoxygalactose transaminase
MYITGKEEVAAITKVIKSHKWFRFEKDSETELFEKEWANKIGTDFAFATTSGTSSLICALIGIDIHPGDEVIIPAYTFMATATAVLAAGAIPVIAEVDDTLTIDPDDVANKISGRTKAIIPVHICGLPSNMSALKKIAHRHKLKIVEDACQADGGSYHGKRLGAIGDAGAFSFNQYKIISCGEGGAVVTNDKHIYQRAFIQHDSGLSFRPFSKEMEIPIFIGQNYRFNNLQASILRAQLKRLDGMLKAMRSEKKFVIEKFSHHPIIKPIRSNDIKGDCGTHIAFRFDTVVSAEKFERDLSAGNVSCSRPINSGKHIFSNWDAVMKHRGAHHRSRNPYFLKVNKDCRMDYSKGMCPKTIDYLSRTVFIPTHPQNTQNEWKRKVRMIEKAAKGLI